MGSRPLHKPEYKKLLIFLKQSREAAGLTQREMADSLEVQQSYIAKSELGERRIDPLEFIAWCEACDIDPSEAIKNLS